MLPSVLAGKVVSVNNTNHNTNKKTYSNRIKNKPKMGVMARSSIRTCMASWLNYYRAMAWYGCIWLHG